MASTSHSIIVAPLRPAPKAEPVAANFVGSLKLADRKSRALKTVFSPDGASLLTATYTPGVVQIWDIASRRETRRFECPPGDRLTYDYALITPDWKTLFVPIQNRSVKSFERDDQRVTRYEYSGEIRVLNIATGEENESIRATKGSAPDFVKLSPSGRFLVCAEQPSYESTNLTVQGITGITVVRDLSTGKSWKLGHEDILPFFLPDEKTVVSVAEKVTVTATDKTSTTTLKILDLSTGKEIASKESPDRDRHFGSCVLAPNGSVAAASLGGKKGAPLEICFYDAKTLEARGKLLGKGDPSRSGWFEGAFTPDGKRFVSLDGVGNAVVWNVTGQVLERTYLIDNDVPARSLAISPNGKTLAVGWVPREVEKVEDEVPDPRDFPQPRVTLIDLTGGAPNRVLIAPRGRVGMLAFSPNSRMLAFGSTGDVHLFDLAKSN